MTNHFQRSRVAPHEMMNYSVNSLITIPAKAGIQQPVLTWMPNQVRQGRKGDWMPNQVRHGRKGDWMLNQVQHGRKGDWMLNQVQHGRKGEWILCQVLNGIIGCRAWGGATRNDKLPVIISDLNQAFGHADQGVRFGVRFPDYAS
jgi:hypothetical protein